MTAGDETTERSTRIVLTGHVDHGKSTLIGRLLYETRSLSDEMLAALEPVARSGGEEHAFAYLLDHLEEERRNNITIDTTQIFLRWQDQTMVLIDAPGHKEFVRNMITGASQADAAVVIVAANEGVCEQTRRHCNLLGLIGVRQIIVAVNKMDTVLYSQKIFDHICGELTEHFRQWGIVVNSFIPISAQHGHNLMTPSDKTPWYIYRPLLPQMLTLQPASRASDVLAAPIQDVYSRNGSTLAVGKVESGRLAAGQRVRLYPRGQDAVVEQIETSRGVVDWAQAPWCVAMRLSPSPHVARGDVVGSADHPLPSSRQVKANLFWMSQSPLAEGRELTFRCATQSRAATVSAIRRCINSETMRSVDLASHAPTFTDIVEVELELDQPAVVMPLDQLPELGRFTLSDGDEVCAGGIVSA